MTRHVIGIRPMREKRTWFSLLTAGAMIAISSSASAQPDLTVYEVPARYASCILDQRKAYLASKGIVITIFPELCPIVTPNANQRTQSAINPGGVVNPDSATIVVPKREAGCFFDRLKVAQRAHRSTSGMILVDTSRCR